MKRSFMDFIYHNNRVFAQQWVDHCFSHQHSISHVFYFCFWAHCFLKANSISDLFKKRLSLSIPISVFLNISVFVILLIQSGRLVPMLLVELQKLQRHVVAECSTPFGIAM